LKAATTASAANARKSTTGMFSEMRLTSSITVFRCRAV
jgi:hypothetical protein